MVLDHFLQQLVVEPTLDGNVLDLLLTDCSERVHKVEVVVNFSDADHVAVQFLVEAGRRVAQRSRRKVYNFRKANFNQFRDLLAVIPCSSCFS